MCVGNTVKKLLERIDLKVLFPLKIMFCETKDERKGIFFSVAIRKIGNHR